ncbi:hypothetical protein KDI_24700 [Dictyobacter arantiisoli]|uniref:Uncharacterized protein n=2 Tax=Dictyobacter arantiisoli TaxID=2014874 RepID=A0A5A5TCN1_9CHLR|nr:hypothetical protein KDI_24700 [Dictyobacter arantiisoli]
MRLRKQQERNAARRTVVIILSVLLILILTSAFGSSAYGYSYYQQQQPRMERYANEQLPQMTRIYDRNNTLLYQAYDSNSKVGNGGRRLAVRYQDIPMVMQDAMTAIEDKNFWSNAGIDPLAIIRAGASSYGGASTITQQLIKNLTGDKDPSFNRKLNEAAMAIGLTQQFPKQKILELYFNVAPFGSQDAGVEIAAQDLFGLTSTCQPDQPCAPAISQLEYDQKTKKNDPLLGLARASLLAGIPNSPVSFDPTLGPTNKAAALARQKLVLQAMFTQGKYVDGKPLTNAMVKEAEALTAKMTFTPPKSIKLAPGFVDYVINQVETALGNGDANAGVNAFVTGGLNIQTTLDLNLNNYTQAAIQRHLYQADYQKTEGYTVVLKDNNNVNNGAVVVEDAKNGEILSMIGSANYYSSDRTVTGFFNAAVGARPPGSTFKPFDYATAFQMGWNPGIDLRDDRTYFPNGAQAGSAVPLTDDQADSMPTVYAPYDYQHTYQHKTLPIRLGWANSYNVPAIRAMQYAGVGNVLNTVKRLGITFGNTDGLGGLSWAIGSKDVSLLQMVGGYQAFANGGKRVAPQTVLNIWDNAGNVVYHYNEQKPPSSRVFSPQVAYQVTSVLTDEPSRAYEFTGDHDLSFADVDRNCAVSAVCDHQVAAKTGTTDSFRDNWTIGYTPDVVVGTWVGNSDNSPMNNVIGITGAAPIWHSVMERSMGWCNYSAQTQVNPTSDPSIDATDGIPCGNISLPFSKHPQYKFTVPSGLKVGMPAGLPGDAGVPDIMLNSN